MSEMQVIPLRQKAAAVEQFSLGDVVKLRGGDVEMTVRAATKTRVTTDWHNDARELCSADFIPIMLEIVEKAPSEEK